MFETCIRCGSERVDKLTVNRRIDLNYPEVKTAEGIKQRVITPTNALVCQDCGHIEFYMDRKKE